MPNVHVVIPDTQAKSGVPTDHLGWIGQYIVDQFHDANIKIVHLGDHADMPSLSQYDKGRKSMEGRRYTQDILAANEAWSILNAPLVAFNSQRRKTKHRAWNPERHILLGNHEDRIDRAVEADAQLENLLSTNQLIYADTGWTVHQFLKPVFLDGIGYAHYWQNTMTGKPLGGSALARLKSLGHSYTMGHQQVLDYGIRFVRGKSQHALVSGACYLHNEDYKGYQGNAHWRGIVICHEVNDGSYDPMFISLDYLCRRYENTSLINFMKKKYKVEWNS